MTPASGDSAAQPALHPTAVAESCTAAGEHEPLGCLILEGRRNRFRPWRGTLLDARYAASDETAATAETSSWAILSE